MGADPQLVGSPGDALWCTPTHWHRLRLIHPHLTYQEMK
jgi:hypothetical protein